MYIYVYIIQLGGKWWQIAAFHSDPSSAKIGSRRGPTRPAVLLERVRDTWHGMARPPVRIRVTPGYRSCVATPKKPNMGAIYSYDSDLTIISCYIYIYVCVTYHDSMIHANLCHFSLSLLFFFRHPGGSAWGWDLCLVEPNCILQYHLVI